MFIELTSRLGVKMLFNIQQINVIYPCDKATIEHYETTYAQNVATVLMLITDTSEDLPWYVQESYETIKFLIRSAS